MAYGDDLQHNPYAAPQEDFAPVVDVGPTKAYGYAGFWLRFVAYIIDYFIANIMGVAVVLPFAIVMAGLSNSGPGPKADELNPTQVIVIVLMYGALIAASIGYYAGMESSRYQATPGKMVLGLKVTDLNGRRVSFGRAVGRLFAKILSIMICLIGCIMAAFTERKQALHDMIAGTLVVRTRP